MAGITFSNTAVDMRLENDNFGIAPLQNAQSFLESYEPVYAEPVDYSPTYVEISAYDASYQYTTVSLWISGSSYTSVTLSKIALEIDATGFYASMSGSLTITDEGWVSGTISGLTIKNTLNGLSYMTASGLNESIDDNAYGSLDSTSAMRSCLAGNDVITGGAFGDYLMGYGGSDTLKGNGGSDSLNGGSGNDSLFGGSGNDTYLVDNVGDRVFETSTTTSTIDSGGRDLVSASISFTLGRHVENLTLSGSAAINGTGNELANTLTGNVAANWLIGAAGADRLYGGAGSDVLTGGAGGDWLYGGNDSVRDLFDFNALSDSVNSARDRVYNFVRGVDDIDLSTLDAKVLTTDAGYNNVFAFSGTTARAYSVWYVKADVDADGLIDDLLVSGDVNGNTAADFEIAIVGITSISATDFIL